MADWKERGKIALLWTAVPCLFAITISACLMLLQGRDGFVDAENKLDDVVARIDFTLDHLNAPCKGSGADKADNCGTLALAGQTMVNAGDLIKLSQRVEQQQATIFGTRLPAMMDHADASLTNLDAATAKIGPVLDSTKARIDGLQPVEDNLAKFTADFDANSGATFGRLNGTIDQANSLLGDKNIPLILGNVQSITLTGAHMLQTGDQVESKLASCTLHPTFWCNFKTYMLLGAQTAGYLLK